MPGAANPTETRMQRKLLRAYLKAEPSWIVIQRPVMTTTPAGGLVKGAPEVFTPQLFRLVPFKKRLTSLTRDTPDGNIINLQYVLIGEYTADVMPGDYFEYEGGTYDVISIEPQRSYRLAANITYRGRKDEVWG